MPTITTEQLDQLETGTRPKHTFTTVELDDMERQSRSVMFRPIDPAEYVKKAGDAWDISLDLQSPLSEIRQHYEPLTKSPQKQTENISSMMAAPDPTMWQSFKEFFIGKPEDRIYLPPDADRMEVLDKYFKLAVGTPLRTFLKYGKGRLLGAPDILWAGLKQITPDDFWDDEVKNMTLGQAMDWAAGYNPSGFVKMAGETAEFMGRLRSVAPIAQELGIIGNTPKDIDWLIKAGEYAKLFGTTSAIEQIQKATSQIIDPTEAEYGYEGPKAVLWDMAVGAILSIAETGVSKVFDKLAPSERARALSVLGLDESATPEEINAAARNLARQYHPDKAKGFIQQFEEVIAARNILRNGAKKDIVFRGQKAIVRGRLIEGEIATTGIEIVPTQATGKFKPVTPTQTTPETVVGQPEAIAEPKQAVEGGIEPKIVEEIAQDFHKLTQFPLERTREGAKKFIQAINNKDVDYFSKGRLHPDNKLSRKWFTKLTDIQLPKTVSGTEEVLRQFLGEGRYDKFYADKEAQRQSEINAINEAKQKQAEEDYLSEKFKIEGAVKTRKEWLQGLIDKNYKPEIAEIDGKKQYRLISKDDTFYKVQKKEYDAFLKLQQPSPPAAKQAWEMTRSEFATSEAERTKGMTKTTRQAALFGPNLIENHKAVIESALSEGKPVPLNVLEEYKGEKWADEALAKLERPPAKAVKQTEQTKESEYAKETIIEPAESPAVDTRQAKGVIPKGTGDLDPTEYKDALEIISKHKNWLGGYEGKGSSAFLGIPDKTEWDAEKRERVVISYEYTPQQIDEAYRTVQKPIVSPMPDTHLYAMPGKEKQMQAIAAKMAKTKGTVSKGTRKATLTTPKVLPKASTSPQDHIKALYKAASKEEGRYAVMGAKIEGDTIVATDGRRMFWAKGKWGKDGMYLDDKSLKNGILGKPTKEDVKFPHWQDIIPDVSAEKPVYISADELEAVMIRVRQAAAMTSEVSRGIMIIKNKDDALGLGFAGGSPEIGHSEINIYEGGKILGAVNPDFLLDALKFHAVRGSKTIEFYFPYPDRPMLIKDAYGKTFTLTMPINIGDEGVSKAVKEVIEGQGKLAIEEGKKKLSQANKELPSEKIKKSGPPAPGEKGHREAGFIELPPITTVGKIEEEHPNIEVKPPQRDIGILQRHILSLTNQAYNTNNPDIIEAAETMADIGMVMQNEIRSQLADDNHFYKKLPKEYRENEGEKFFDLMDKHYSPEEIDSAADIPDEVKPILKHFKLQDEVMRQEVIRQKRAMVKAMFGRKSLGELQKLAAEKGIEIKKPGVTVEEKNRTIAELSGDLSREEIPDDWGRQWGHIQHIFFGQYELSFVDTEGNQHFIGRAENQKEAYEKLADWKEARTTSGFDDADKVKLLADPQYHIPYDVLRLSRKHFFTLEGQIKEAADLQRDEIADALRGIIGRRESKQKWWGALMHRKGMPGYSKDFWRVWSIQSAQFNRWKYLTAMNRTVEPLIEKIKSQGLRGWSQHLEDTKDFMWGRKRSDVGRALDEELQSIPIVQDYVKPFALERWAGMIKSINYWRHLQTGRFYVINSLQLIQTLWPTVGEKGFYRGIKLYYSEKGQELLRKHKIAGISGKLHEIGMKRTGEWQKYTPAGASELRNQGVAFLALYDDGIRRGMSEEEAARYGRLRGQLLTQFAYTPSDIPAIMQGPVGGLIFQYKRFPIKNLELVSRLAREGRWGGVARWLAALVSIGGLRVFTKALPVSVTGYLTYKLYEKIKKEYGKEVADVIDHGLPALIGIDMSGSVNPIDIPQGRNVPEQIGNLMLGPSGQSAIRLITDLTQEKVAKEIGLVPRGLKSFVDSSPAVKQFVYLTKALEQDTSNFDSKQRKQYELDTWDLWKKAFGFRPETETIQRMQFDAMMSLKLQQDEVIDRIVLAIINGDNIEAQDVVQNWSKSFPEAPISADSVYRRIQERQLAQQLPMALRGLKELPETLRVIFAEPVVETILQKEKKNEEGKKQ